MSEFKCPKCGGSSFGSDMGLNDAGVPVVGEMVTCQTVLQHKYIGPYTAHSYCGWRGTRKEAGLCDE